jgi:hypothetical protein
MWLAKMGDGSTRLVDPKMCVSDVYFHKMCEYVREAIDEGGTVGVDVSLKIYMDQGV